MFSTVHSPDNRSAYGIKKFVCDAESDIANLPITCAVGSTAFVIDTSNEYMLNHQGQWKKVQTNGSSSGDIIYDGGDVPGDDIPDSSDDHYIYDGGGVGGY